MKNLVDKFLSIFFNMEIIGSTLIIIALLFVMMVFVVCSIKEYTWANEEEHREEIICRMIEIIAVLGVVVIGEVVYILICYYHPEFLYLFK